jgi:hypothetical protein
MKISRQAIPGKMEMPCLLEIEAANPMCKNLSVTEGAGFMEKEGQNLRLSAASHTAIAISLECAGKTSQARSRKRRHGIS